MTQYTPQAYMLRSRPVEAIRYTPENFAAVCLFIGLPSVSRFDHDSEDALNGAMFVQTLEGVKIATLGDWVVQSESGNLDVLTNELFQQFYAPKRHSRLGRTWVVSALALRSGGGVIYRTEMSRHFTAARARRAVSKYKTFDDPNDIVSVVYQINHVDEVLL